MHLSAGWWEAIGTWAAAFGTVGAIFATLRIASRDNAVRIRVSATVGQIARDPTIPLDRLHLWITVTNLGRRAFLLQTVGWTSGLVGPRWTWQFLKPVFAAQDTGPPNPPLKLQDGDVASWMIPLDEWLDRQATKLIAEPRWLGLRTLRIVAYASTGDSISSKVSKNLTDKIRARLAAAQRSSPGPAPAS